MSEIKCPRCNATGYAPYAPGSIPQICCECGGSGTQTGPCEECGKAIIDLNALTTQVAWLQAENVRLTRERDAARDERDVEINRIHDLEREVAELRTNCPNCVRLTRERDDARSELHSLVVAVESYEREYYCASEPIKRILQLTKHARILLEAKP